MLEYETSQDVDWTGLSHNRIQWQAVVSKVYINSGKYLD
jgi:hypothetical protein